MNTSCKCFARCEADCVCDYDWTPPEVIRLRAELASWQEAFGLLTTLHGSIQIDSSDPMGMAKQIESHVRAELAECKRNGYIVAMRLQQSDLLIDEVEGSALQSFLTREAINAALREGGE